jgi:hypothetical protein
LSFPKPEIQNPKGSKISFGLNSILDTNAQSVKIYANISKHENLKKSESLLVPSISVGPQPVFSKAKRGPKQQSIKSGPEWVFRIWSTSQLKDGRCSLFIPHFQGRNDKIHHKEKEK